MVTQASPAEVGDRCVVRSAVLSDAASLLEIYRPFVVDSTVSFETVAPTIDDFSVRISKTLSAWTWLVASIDGQSVGYAYASAHRERAAYRYSVETSAYVRPDYHRRGIGKRLYRALFDALARLGYCNAFAGITMPNEGSVSLHRSAGFEPIGTFRSVGRKFGAWHDVSWWQKNIRAEPLADRPAG